MKSDQEIKDYFCEIMNPFNPNDIIIHKNNEKVVRFSIPHGAWDIIILNLMNQFLTDDNADDFRLDIITNGERLELDCIYPYDLNKLC